jgi:hypothetical protein
LSPWPSSCTSTTIDPPARQRSQQAATIIATGGDFDVSHQGEVFHGLYYLNGDVTLGASDLSGAVTIVATGRIEISGSSNDAFTPAVDRLLFFSNKTYSQDAKHRG